MANNSDREGLVTLAQILHAGRQRRTLMDAAIAAFRALEPHERVQFLVSVEAEIAATWSKTSLEKIAPEVPPPAPGKAGRPMKYDGDTVQHVLSLAATGMTEREISQETNIPQQSIHKLKIRELGRQRRSSKAKAASPSVPSTNDATDDDAEDDADPVPSRDAVLAPRPTALSTNKDADEAKKSNVDPTPSHDAVLAQRHARGAKITKLREAGWTYRQLADQEKVSQARIAEIHRWYCRQRDHGLAPRSGTETSSEKTAAPAPPPPPSPPPPSPPSLSRKSSPSKPKPLHARPTPPAPSASKAPAAIARDRAPKSKQSKGSPIADSEDSPAVYFKQIAVHDLLTGKDEIDLAKRIEETEIAAWSTLLQGPWSDRTRAIVCAAHAEDGDEAKDQPLRLSTDSVKAAKVLRALDLDRKYIDRVSRELDVKGQKAIRALNAEAVRLRETFVHSNLRLVISMARRYLFFGLPLADLIQEGNLGLIHAVPRFDHRRGLRFSTFASWWIRHALSRSCSDKARTVRIPVHLIDEALKVRRHVEQLTRTLGHEPSLDEIATSTSITKKKLEKILSTAPQLLAQAQSLNAPLGDDEGDGSFIDALADPNGADTASLLIETEEKVQLAAAINRLPPAEADILRKRYGLDGNDARTLKEVGDDKGLSRERIRQIETKALERLRRTLTVNSPPA